MTINCIPYLAPPTITAQSFLVYVNKYPLTFKMGAKDIGFLAKTFEAGDLEESKVVDLRFEFPDCTKPSERSQNKDNRLLAFAFKQLIFARLLPLQDKA